MFHTGNLLEHLGGGMGTDPNALLLFRAAADREFNPAIVNFCASFPEPDDPFSCAVPEAYLRYGMQLKADDGYWQIAQNIANFYTYDQPKRADDGYLAQAVSSLKNMGDLGAALNIEASVVADGYRQGKHPEKALRLFQDAFKHTALEMLSMTGCENFLQVVKGINQFSGKMDFDFSYDYCTDARFEQLLEAANIQLHSCGRHFSYERGSETLTKTARNYLLTGMYLGNFLCMHNLAVRYMNTKYGLYNPELAMALFRFSGGLFHSAEETAILEVNITHLERELLNESKIQQYIRDISSMNTANIAEFVDFNPPNLEVQLLH